MLENSWFFIFVGHYFCECGLLVLHGQTSFCTEHYQLEMLSAGAKAIQDYVLPVAYC